MPPYLIPNILAKDKGMQLNCPPKQRYEMQTHVIYNSGDYLVN
jgi:hypothetical protein